MAIVIGIDEAGYGPNLGPLVVGYSTWEVPTIDVDFYGTLTQSIALKPTPDRLVLCDSKTAGTSIERLQQSVLLAAKLSQGEIPDCFDSFSRFRVPVDVELAVENPTQQQFDWLKEDSTKEMPRNAAIPMNDCGNLPVSLERLTLEATASRIEDSLRQAGVRLLDTGFAEVHPEMFNWLLEKHGNKSRLLGAVTMRVLTVALQKTDSSSARVICDRHGGRKRYRPLLATNFPGLTVEAALESDHLSRYTLRSPTDPAEELSIEFAVGGESNAPVALASMFAKYIREIHMYRWNHYWQQRLPGISPTAGYPLDALRFMKEIRQSISNDEIADSKIWRRK